MYARHQKQNLCLRKKWQLQFSFLMSHVVVLILLSAFSASAHQVSSSACQVILGGSGQHYWGRPLQQNERDELAEQRMANTGISVDEWLDHMTVMAGLADAKGNEIFADLIVQQLNQMSVTEIEFVFHSSSQSFSFTREFWRRALNRLPLPVLELVSKKLSARAEIERSQSTPGASPYNQLSLFVRRILSERVKPK